MGPIKGALLMGYEPQLVNPFPQEFPDPRRGVRGLGCTQHELVDVGKTVADLQLHIDTRFGRRQGEAFGVTKKEVCSSNLNEQWGKA